MNGDGNTMIGLLGAAVAGLFGALMWTIRLVINYQTKRINDLETREGQTLAALAEGVKGVAESVRAIRDMLAGVVDAIKDLRALYMSRGGGGP